MGGVKALHENDTHVAHQVSVMEKRLVKAKTAYMNCIEHNRKLRVVVDEIRRERIIQQDVSGRLRADINTLVTDSDSVEVQIKVTDKQTVKVREQIEDFKVRAKEAIAVHEEKWASLDDGGPDAFDIPGTPPPMESPRDSPAKSAFGDEDDEDEDEPLPIVDEAFFETLPERLGTLTAKQEKRLRDKVGQNEWDSAIVAIQEQRAAEKVARYEEIFDEIKTTLGVHDLEGFSELFSRQEEQNFAIVCAINDLNEEATRLEEAANRARKEREALM